MSVSFFVEFRLQGYAKKYAKWASARTLREARKLRLRNLEERRFVSHITLFGPARTNNLRQVIREVERIGRKYTLVPFKLGGFDKFQNPDANWLYLDVHPSSPDLEQFRYELAQSLCRSERMIYDTCKPYDHKSKYKFHSAIGKYNPRDKGKFEKLLDYAETKCSLETFKQHRASVFRRLFNTIKKYIFRAEEDDPRISLHLIRVTVLGRGNRIQSEYDLVLKRLLSRREVLSQYWRRKTIEKLRELLSPPQEERLPISGKSVYFIGDTHFDHKNIIKYCHRPFSNVAEMNRVIKNNWNNTVGDNDTVYFLGDWTFGWGHKPAKYYRAKYWEKQLNGVIVSIRGSHDGEARGIKFQDFKELHVNGYNFLLIHNPNPSDPSQTTEQKQKLENWHGWIIHGHVHNHNWDRYPFINGEQKTINVSSEVIHYKPVSLSYLLSLDLDSIKRMRTINDQPERK